MFWTKASPKPGHIDFMASHAHHVHCTGLGSKLGPTREALLRPGFLVSVLLQGGSTLSADMFPRRGAPVAPEGRPERALRLVA